MDTKPQDARHVPLSNVDKLRQDAHAAAEVRALQTHPDVVALRVERVRSQVDGLMWAGLLLGLAFTMVNVQIFAAEGASVWSLAWMAAWLLDPMVSLVLIAVLRAEQVTARYQVATGKWVQRTKQFAFLATYTMNTWKSWVLMNPAGIVLHSVPPAMVYLAAETGPILRDRLTEAVVRAARLVPGATDTTVNTPPSTQDGDANTVTNTPSAPVAEQRAPRSRKPAARTSSKPRRPSRYEYLDRARAAWQPGIVVTPAWVREVIPDISRGTSKVVSDLLNDEMSNTWHTTTFATDVASADTTAIDRPGRAA